MSKVFLTILRMGMVSGYTILVVLLIRRLLLRRFPKRYSYLLWGIVFLRLICPVGIQSSFSLVPDVLFIGTGSAAADKNAGGTETGGAGTQMPASGDSVLEKSLLRALSSAQRMGMLQDAGERDKGIPADSERNADELEKNVNQSEGNAGEEGGNQPEDSFDQENNSERITDADAKTKTPAAPLASGAAPEKTAVAVLVLCVLWIAGILIFWLVWARSIRRFRKRLLGAVRVEEGVYETKQVAASFVDGIFRPVIYIAPGLFGQARQYVICHERVHVSRRDPLIKAAALFLVSIYWFHPLVWLAFKKMCEDMEMSCDERVVELLGSEIKKEYSSTLLKMAQEADEVSLLAAFGGNEVKSRVKNVLSYRRPKKWLAILLMLVVVAVGIGLGLNPGGKEAEAANGRPDGTGEEERQNDAGTITPEQDGADAPDEKGSQGGVNGPDAEGGESNAQKADSAARYASVLNQYYTALKEEWEAERLAESELSIVLRSFYNGDALEKIGYLFLDLDGDGEEELLIGAVTENISVDPQIFDLYTIKDGVPTQVFSGWERSRYYLCKEEDGTFLFANEGSSGAARTSWYYYRLRDKELVIVQAVRYDAMENEEHPWFTADGEDAILERFETAQEETAQSIIDAYGARYMGLEYTPFSKFIPQTQDGGISGAEKADISEAGRKVSGADLENQLNLILSQKQRWELSGDYLPQEVKYTVADLDQNGRLELIAASCQGTGIYTYSYVYEVSEDGRSLNQCARTLVEEYYSQPDVITNLVPVYRSPQTGQYNYIFRDYVRDGAAHYYESQCIWNLQDGYLEEQYLASMAIEYEDRVEDPLITYQAGGFMQGPVTNQEEYDSAADRAFAGWQKGAAEFFWFGAQEENGADRTEQSWRESLEEAYEGFHLKWDASPAV